MSGFSSTPKFILRLIHFPPRVAYALGLGPLFGRVILLLTTTGRKTGRPRVTPLQYEEVDGTIYISAARGRQADWFRNIVANPNVQIQCKANKFRGVAEPITDCARIADFLELRLRRHPRMISAMLRMEGLGDQPSRAQLEQYASQLTMVAIKPVDSRSNGEKRIISK